MDICTYDVASGSEINIDDLDNITIEDSSDTTSDNYMPEYDLVYDDTTIGDQGVTQYFEIFFKIGDNIVARWEHLRGISGTYYYPYLADIVGTGDMYESKDDFICLTSTAVTWDNLSSNSTNMFLKLAVDHAELIIPEGITSIATNFFSGFRTKKLVLPESLKYIGDYAFAPQNTNIARGYRQLITELTIPKNVEHIGIRAFADMEYCEKINILNPDYVIEDYGSTGNGIFRMAQTDGITHGTNIDEDNCFITEVYSENKANYAYNWKLNFRRSIKSLPLCAFRCATSIGKILEINLYNEGELAMYTDVLSYTKYCKLVEIDDANASPIRLCVNNETKKIMAISY